MSPKVIAVLAALIVIAAYGFFMFTEGRKAEAVKKYPKAFLSTVLDKGQQFDCKEVSFY